MFDEAAVQFDGVRTGAHGAVAFERERGGADGGFAFEGGIFENELQGAGGEQGCGHGEGAGFRSWERG